MLSRNRLLFWVFLCGAFLTISFFVSGCWRRVSLRMSTGGPGSTHYVVGKKLKSLLEKRLRVKINTLSGQGSRQNLRFLINKEADLVLAQNDATLRGLQKQEHLRTVAVLYPQVLFIIYKNTIKASSLRELLKGRKVFVGPRDGGTSQLVRQLFALLDIPPSSYQLQHGPYHSVTLRGKADIVCRVTGFNSSTIRRLLGKEGGKLWSLDDVNLLPGGTAVDGFCLNHPLARPFVIPRFAYANAPTQPILTLAVDNVLLASSEMDPYLVYDIAHLLDQQREWLALQDPLFRSISFDFKKHPLHFPPHRGVQMFLWRDRPSFFVRYAEFLALLVTLFTLLFGGFSRLIRWRQQKRKDEIDNYYAAILELEKSLATVQQPEEIEALMDRLFEIRDIAFERLIHEKLEGNEHFRILLQLIELSYKRLQKERNYLLRKA